MCVYVGVYVCVCECVCVCVCVKERVGEWVSSFSPLKAHMWRLSSQYTD